MIFLYSSGHINMQEYFCLFGLILYVSVNNFQSCLDGSSWVAEDKVSCSLTQHCDSIRGETQTSNHSILRSTNWANVLRVYKNMA